MNFRRQAIKFFVPLAIAGLAFVGIWLALQARRNNSVTIVAMQEEASRFEIPIHLKDLDNNSIPDEENAFTDFQKWRKQLTEVGKALFRAEYESESPDEFPTAADVSNLETLLNPHQQMIEEMIQAASKKHLRIPQKSDKPDDVFRELSDFQLDYNMAKWVLLHNARLKLLQGRLDESVRCAIASMKWSEKFAQLPGAEFFLFGSASRLAGVDCLANALYTGSLNQESYAAIESALLNYDTFEVLRSSIYSEIPVSIDVKQVLLPNPASTESSKENEEKKFISEMKSKAELKLLVDGRFIELPEVADASKQLIGSELSLLSVRSAQLVAMSAEARRRCLLALLEWRREGGTARNLDDLDLVRPWAKDPWDGGPLKFRLSDFGPVIYVVGENRVDDGGEKSLIDRVIDDGILPIQESIRLNGASNQ
ncbi:MAG: hypothetical protein JNK90_29935 [Planctomycetaceae bacterium]|nr:hypothetical protein [Planctomycetaceae bacterium]